jgi:hypothetical protein
MGISRFASSGLALLALAACDNSVTLQVESGPQDFEVSTSSLTLPEQLRDDTSGTARIATVDCSGTGICPSTGSFAIECAAGVCDPAPVQMDAALGDVVDFEVLVSEARTLVRHIDSIEIVSGSYAIDLNTASIDVPDVEIYWGPETAAAIDPSMGVTRLGTLPGIPAGSTDGGQLVIDAAGSAALSDFLVDTSKRVRFFARTRVDLAPGGPFPTGAVQGSVNLRVRVVGALVR